VVQQQNRNNQLEEVKNSASIDLEWIPFKGRYEHDKTRIFAASFCSSVGESTALHVSDYPTERELIEDILYYFDQFPLTFGWYSTGVAVYDDDDDNGSSDGDDDNSRFKGRDSDLFILHQRCQLYGLDSPFEVKKTYVKLINDSNENDSKHIDLNKVFDKKVIRSGVFEDEYRTIDLDTVSKSLFGVGNMVN
jgi:hypothetical protein